jgi:hypothetical protein
LNDRKETLENNKNQNDDIIGVEQSIKEKQ